MPRRFFRRYLPDARSVRASRGLSLLGTWLHDPNLWHLNRHSVAAGSGIGLFLAFMPMPFQMVAAALAALPLRANLPVAVASVWVSNPLTMAPMLYFQYRVGKMVLGERIQRADFEPTLEWYWAEFDTIWQPLLAGSLLCGLAAGLAGYGLIHLVWRINIRLHLRQRRARKKDPD